MLFSISEGRVTPEYAIVIPARNEADNLGTLLGEIREAMAGKDFEIICVDDGSTDATLAELKRLAADIPDLRVLRHPQACGQSAAVLSGIRAARAPLIITLDGDGQNDPADIPALLAAWITHREQQPLLVIGQRSKRHDNWLRKLSSRIANNVRSKLLGDGTPDSGCGLKLFRREDYLRLPCFDHMHRFLPALFIRATGKVVSVPVSHRPRLKGESKYGVHNRLWAGIVDLFGVRWLQRRTRHPQTIEETNLKD